MISAPVNTSEPVERGALDQYLFAEVLKIVAQYHCSINGIQTSAGLGGGNAIVEMSPEQDNHGFNERYIIHRVSLPKSTAAERYSRVNPKGPLIVSTTLETYIQADQIISI